MKLHGRYAIITGATQGLGAAIAERYVAEGASVLLCARDEAKLEEIRRRLSERCAKGQQVLVERADVAEPAQIDALVARAMRDFPRLDVLVNNAGVYGPFGPIEEIDWDEWTEAIQINLMGTVYASRTVVPYFKRQKYGKIVCLSGGGATNPMPRVSAYAASKAAVVRFVETLAQEVREFAIDVNAVAPGALATRLTDALLEAGPERVGAAFHARILEVQKSGGTPLEVPANLCVYLGSADSDGITGKLLSAVWDPWQELQKHRADLDGTDIYALRRIVPKDRGRSWGDR